MADTHKVWASSFADPADIRAFNRCKARGGTDKYCFQYGDNGVGYWGHDTSEGSCPSCALPPEVIKYYGLGKDSPLLVTNPKNGKDCCVLVRDRMPTIAYLEKVKSKYRIDLNPTACAILGISIPAEAEVIWRKLCK